MKHSFKLFIKSVYSTYCILPYGMILKRIKEILVSLKQLAKLLFPSTLIDLFYNEPISEKFRVQS